mmetsp:Transcript_9448/g.19058  ORF Transcript_9448/g.19058 Transcript_9448/m.19058 type:complete len:84 (+) Transcript_9448:112-363(+)
MLFLIGVFFGFFIGFRIDEQRDQLQKSNNCLSANSTLVGSFHSIPVPSDTPDHRQAMILLNALLAWWTRRSSTESLLEHFGMW